MPLKLWIFFEFWTYFACNIMRNYCGVIKMNHNNYFANTTRLIGVKIPAFIRRQKIFSLTDKETADQSIWIIRQ